MARRSNIIAPLKALKGIGRLRERDGDAKWFPIEFLSHYDEYSKVRKFAYVRREDSREIADGHYFFLYDLGERKQRWRKWKGHWQVGWRWRPGL